MPTNDLSNNKIPAPPPPEDWGKNRKPAKNNDKNENTLGSTPSKTSNSTQLKRGLSEVTGLHFLKELENKIKHRKEEEKENNASDKTKNDRSNIKQSKPNRISTTKPVSPRVLSSQQDNCNSNKPSSNSGTNNSTQSEKGLSENPIQLATEQKIDTPILINTLVGISKTAALKYSIATLLLCISSVTAGIYTYLSISVTLSDPVLFTVIAFVSASVMLSLAAYLINSHLSAINSEKGVDPGRKQSQYSELQKEAESLGHSNTPIPSLEMSGTPSAPPPPPPLLQNAAQLPPPPTASKRTEKPKNGAPKKADKPDHTALLEQIRKGYKLKKVPGEQKNCLSKDGLKTSKKQEEESVAEKQESDVQSRNKGVHQIRKVENQKTDKEPSNSESIQQGNYMNERLISTVLKQRNRSGFQDEELDSLEERDDSLCSLEESLTEPNKMFNKDQENHLQRLDVATVLSKNVSTLSLLESSSNNLLSNSGNVSDDEDWETQPQSIPNINLDKTPQERRQEKGASPSATKGSGGDQVSNEVQESFTVSVKEKIKNLQSLNK